MEEGTYEAVVQFACFTLFRLFRLHVSDMARLIVRRDVKQGQRGLTAAACDRVDNGEPSPACKRLVNKHDHRFMVPLQVRPSCKQVLLTALAVPPG